MEEGRGGPRRDRNGARQARAAGEAADVHEPQRQRARAVRATAVLVGSARSAGGLGRSAAAGGTVPLPGERLGGGTQRVEERRRAAWHPGVRSAAGWRRAAG